MLMTTARDCLDNPATAPDHAVALNNVFRLLELYRVNSFFGFHSATTPMPEAETLTLTPTIEQHVQEVREVLEGSVAIAFEGQSKEEAISIVEEVLRKITYPDKGEVAAADRELTLKFFVEAAEKLRLS
ncbi:MAG: hypothetical protein F4X83_10305 [Chloroflexi bacterium]|nr:hypothetical protein [Chloroflexota bacterium]